MHPCDFHPQCVIVYQYLAVSCMLVCCVCTIRGSAVCLWGKETQPRMRAVRTTRVIASQNVQGSTLRRKKECVYECRLLLYATR